MSGTSKRVISADPYAQRDAAFSDCRKYRYALWRHWGGSPHYAMFVGLNPSTADELQDDPTVRRCIGYARDWGYGGMWMTNIFAYRATLPSDMKAFDEPVGPDNDWALKLLARNSGVVVAAWGTHGVHLDRANQVRKLLPNLHYLRLTQDGHPAHPLYLPKTLKPLPWTAPR